MKKLTLTFLICLFTVLLSAPSYAEWKKVGENVHGQTFYVDFERIRKHGGYVYWWLVQDLPKPFQGILSFKSYHQGDCNLFRYKIMSKSFHKEPMGRGTGDTPPVPKEHKDWKYPPPNTSAENILKKVCNHVK